MPLFKADPCPKSEPDAAAGPSNPCRPPATERPKKLKNLSARKMRNKLIRETFPDLPFEEARERFNDEENRRISRHWAARFEQGAPALAGWPARGNAIGGALNANWTTSRNLNGPQMRPWNHNWHPHPDGRPSWQPVNHGGRQPPNLNLGGGSFYGHAHTNAHSQRPDYPYRSPDAYEVFPQAQARPAATDRAKQKGPAAEVCFTTGPIRRGYSFVEKGNVYITRTAKKLTKDAGRAVYIVRSSTRTILGIQVPREVHEKAIEHEQLTREDREYARSQKLAREKSEASRCLGGMFGKMPEEDCKTIVDGTFVVNSGRVGRSGKISLPERLRLAAIAHLRHNHTDYEQQLVRRRMEAEREPGLARHGKKYTARMNRARDQARAAVSRKIEETWKSWEPSTTSPWASVEHVPKGEYLSKVKAPSRRRGKKAASDSEDEEDEEAEEEEAEEEEAEEEEAEEEAEAEDEDEDEELQPQPQQRYNTRSKNRQQTAEVFGRAPALEELVRKRKDREEVGTTAKRVKGQVKVKVVESESSEASDNDDDCDDDDDDEQYASLLAREGTRSPNRGGQDEEEESKVDTPNIVRKQDESRALVTMNAPPKEREVIYISD